MVEALPRLDGVHLLLVDDDASIQRSLGRALRGLGAEVQTAGGLAAARIALQHALPDAVLADLQLRDGSGLDLLPDYLARHAGGLFYLITGYGSVESAVESLRRGVRDYLQKPVDPIELAARLRADLQLQPGSDLSRLLAPWLKFRDEVMAAALADLPRYAQSGQPVLISGETGAGKELVARALHGLSDRAARPFVEVNCGAIPETILESELFGHEKGAFTGAQRSHRGRFEQADGGTLFLDEIGEMPLAFQVRLLRVLEAGVVQRVGSEQSRPVDVRVVAATHRDLAEHVGAGLFREDLYYRLEVLPLELPPLRKRPADITLLARHFLARTLRELGRDTSPPRLAAPASALLQAHRWPGNVRELRNLMTRLAVRLPANLAEIDAELLRPLLPAGLEAAPKEIVPIPADATLEHAETLLICAALERSNGNRKLAAQRLGIGERTLRRKLNLR